MNLFLIILLSLFIDDARDDMYDDDGIPKIIYPVMDATQGCLMGGVYDRLTYSPDTCAMRLTGKENYKIYDINGYVREMSLNKPDTLGEPCPENYNYESEELITKNPLEITDGESFLIGLACPWEPMPRIPKKAEVSKKYKKIVSNFLKSIRMPKTRIKIQKIYKIDLEGDGPVETLIEATYYKNDESIEVFKGDYSMVLLLRKNLGQTEKILLLGDFIRTKEDAEFQIPYYNKIHSIADVNGDGVMDMIIDSSYYEGEFCTVIAFIDGYLESIMGCGCGV